MPLLAVYLLILATQLPVWLCGGLLWAWGMVAAAGWQPAQAAVRGFGWGLFMWVLVGNYFALGAVRRRSAELPAPDRGAFRTALERACGKLRLIVLAESADEVVL